MPDDPNDLSALLDFLLVDSCADDADMVMGVSVDNVGQLGLSVLDFGHLQHQKVFGEDLEVARQMQYATRKKTSSCSCVSVLAALEHTVYLGELSNHSDV